ncbi:MAG: ABC transporter substrate-binding protein, partial [Chloroflexota bacterium]
DMGGLTRLESKDMMEEYRKYPGIVLDIKPYANTYMLFGRYVAGKPWNDVRVRRAVSLVIDRKACIIAKSGDPTLGMEAGFQVAGTAWALPRDELLKALGIDGPMEKRIAQAKKLMADAGYPDGFKAEIMVDTQAWWRNVASVIADNLKRTLNIELLMASVDEATTAQRLLRRQYDLHTTALNPALGEPSEMLAWFVTGAPANFMGYSNPKVDELILKQDATLNYGERLKVVHELEKLLIQELPWIPLFTPMRGTPYWNYVKGYSFTGRLYDKIPWHEVWLDK